MFSKLAHHHHCGYLKITFKSGVFLALTGSLVNGSPQN